MLVTVTIKYLIKNNKIYTFKIDEHLEIDGDARVFSTSGVLSISNTCFSIGFTISLLAIGVFNEFSSIFLRFSLETISSTGDRFLVLVFAGKKRSLNKLIQINTYLGRIIK